MLLNDLPGINSIKFGNLWLKPASIMSQLASSVRLVILESEEHPNYLGRRGTATLLRSNSKPLIACTRHQLDIEKSYSPTLDKLDPIRFSTTKDGQNLSNIPVTKCIFETSQGEEEFHDILLFEPDNNWSHLNAELPAFFPIKGFHEGKDLCTSYVYGCPSLEGVMEY
jgi:hypothetical protein